MTSGQIAKALGVTRRTIYRWIEAGCPHEVKPSSTNVNNYDFDLEQVNEWRKLNISRS